uniref:Pregnancy up-regulated nonubiquitous CaM kinase n=1 Tax=Pipistrellus kuhlii TaxID=59472 RepID=A0A7J7R4E1_PIPKU|nr:pregnancy up-regulated nonubiquitous CaM kinase [Pipistrellus kuhlii]
MTSLNQPKTSSGTFWSETRRRGSRASRPCSIFGSLEMLPLTKTFWARSASRSRRILPGTTGSEHSMPPLSCATSGSWGRARRGRRAQSGGWPATATPASGPASPPTGDAQMLRLSALTPRFSSHGSSQSSPPSPPPGAGLWLESLRCA